MVRASRGKFSRGGHTRKIGLLRVIFGATPGIPVFSGPKMNLENCLPHPCMKKNGIAH